MAFTGYKPAPSGGYHFERDDGSPMYLFGPQADDLANYIDQTRPPMLAQNMSTPDPMASTYGAGPTVEAATTPPAPPPVRSDAVPNMSLGAAGPAAQPAPVAPPQQPAPYEPAAVGAPPEEQATVKYRYVPPSAAVNPQRMAERGVAVPVSQTISGAIPETPQEHAERLKRQETFRAESDAAMSEIRAASAERTAAAEQTQTSALNAAIKADMDQKDALRQQAAAKSAADAKWGEIQKNNEAAAAMKVDPNRLFHGKNGAAVAIGSAIFQGLGAFGASLSRGPNYAQQIIQGAIDRDIASQTDEIHRKGEAARNAVADYARTYGLTLEEAKLAVKSTQLRYAASLADMNAAKMGTIDAKTRAAATNLDLLKQSAMYDAQWKEMYEGRVQKHMAYVQPQAGSRGGFIPVSREETIKTGKPSPEQQNAARQQQAYELERRVTMPDGSFAYATTKDRADNAQKVVDVQDELNTNAKRMQGILSHGGDSLDRQMRAEYVSKAARNVILMKQLEDLGAITKSDMELAGPLTGSGGEEAISTRNALEDTTTKLNEAIQHVNFRARNATKQLFKDIPAQVPVSKTEKGIGIEEQH